MLVTHIIAFVNVIEPDDAVNSVTDTLAVPSKVLRIGNLSVAKGDIGPSITHYMCCVCANLCVFTSFSLFISSFVCVYMYAFPSHLVFRSFCGTFIRSNTKTNEENSF